jgi:Flp pilus assembly protein TadG
MKCAKGMLQDDRGTTVVEFALTAPLFLALLFGVTEAGIALWTQFGLQYGVEAAARCATVKPATCGTSSQIASYAATNALGLSVPASAFTASTAACGNQVQASYAYTFFVPGVHLPAVTLSAESCFPS